MIRSSTNGFGESSSEEYTFSFSPRMVLTALVVISLGFSIMSGIGRLLRWYVLPYGTTLWELTTKFDVNLEYNFPTYYSSLMLLSCSLLLVYIAFATKAHKGKYLLHWQGLSGIFLFLAMDEMLELHEILTGPMRSLVNADGFFHYAWVIPYAFFTAIVGLVYIRFLGHLPVGIRNLFLLSGAIFVGGALGLEMVVGYLMTAGIGTETQLYVLATLEEHLEELLEMLGVALFIYALLLYIRMKYGQVTIRLTTPRA